jgi:hypothetical protein
MAGQLLCGRGQETGHENDEGSSPQEEIGRNGGGHGLHVGLGRGKNHSAALVFATFFRAESEQNSSHPCARSLSVWRAALVAAV